MKQDKENKHKGAKRKILSNNSSEDNDNSEAENTKPRQSISDSMYSTEDSSHSRVDTTNNSVVEEDNFSQLKTKNTKRSRRARQAPDVSSDSSQDDEPLANRLRNQSDSQYSSDDQINSPKKRISSKRKIASDSEDRDNHDFPSTSTGIRTRKKQRTPVNSNNSDEDRSSLTEELSDSSIQSVQTFSSVTTESLGSFVQDGSDDSSIRTVSSDSQTKSSDSHSEESNGLPVSNKKNIRPKKKKKTKKIKTKKSKKVEPKKYKKVQCGGDTSDEDEDESEKLPENNANYHTLMYKYNNLKNPIFYGKGQEVHDIIYGNSYEDLVLPVFCDLLWVLATKSVRDVAQKALALVSAGVDVNIPGPKEHSNNTLLHCVSEKAYKKKYEQFAFTLMRFGADINRCNGQGNTVLFCAVKCGSIAIVEELMARDVEVNEQYHRVLRLAAENSSCDSAKILTMLIEYKALDKEMKKERAMHALRWLVKNGNDLTAMRILLDYNLPLDEQDEDGQTVLHNAVIDAKNEMVKLLLEYGANPRVSRRDGRIPLWHAAGLLTSTISGLLIKYGASVHDRNHADGQYPLHRACNAGSSENIKLLLHFGANVNVTDFPFGRTPFGMVNCYNMKDGILCMIWKFAFLRSKGIQIDFRDSKKIRAYEKYRKYYCKCSSELEKMKDMMIFDKISVYSILDCDVEKISRLIENCEFTDKLYEMNRENIIEDKFPQCNPVIRERIKIAFKKREKLSEIEDAMKESTKNALPAEIYEKIAYIACRESLIDFDLDVIGSGCVQK